LIENYEVDPTLLGRDVSLLPFASSVAVKCSQGKSGSTGSVRSGEDNRYRDRASRLAGLVTVAVPLLTANLFCTQDRENLLARETYTIVYDFFSFCS